MHEMGFILFNRLSIFLISGVLTFTSFGLIIIYFMVFSGTFSTLILDSTSLPEDSFWGKKTIYVLGLSIFLLPFAVKKELQEYIIISVLLFGALFSFILLIIIQLGVNGWEYN